MEKTCKSSREKKKKNIQLETIKEYYYSIWNTLIVFYDVCYLYCNIVLIFVCT